VTQSRHLVRARSLTGPAPRPAEPAQPWLSGDTTGRGLRWNHGGTVAAAVGKVFFTLGGADYVCSGTLAGGARPVVATAAHCVSGGPGASGDKRWATHWLFVPGYREGAMPYGEFTAQRFLVEPAWTGPQGGSEQYDVSFVQITGIKPDGKPSAVRPPAGLPVRFAGSQDAAVDQGGYIFGYPAEPPYTGLFQNYCAGLVTAAGGSVHTSCQMTAGDSGGPWLAGFSPRTGRGTIVAVSTYKLSNDMKVLYGAVLGPAARGLYQQALSTAG
jgi:V8-like Glu-specific endopeptidase